MKTTILLLVFLVLVGCNKFKKLESVLNEFEKSKSDYSIIYTSATIDDEIALYKKLQAELEKEDNVYVRLDEHIQRLASWKDQYLIKLPFIAIKPQPKPDPAPPPPIEPVLNGSRFICYSTLKNSGEFKIKINGSDWPVLSDHYNRFSHIRIIELKKPLEIKPGDAFSIEVPISYNKGNDIIKEIIHIP
jgi:hypothetical protein